VELHGEGMFGQCDARPLLVSLQGRLERNTKTSGSRLAIHIASEEEIWCLEGEAFCCEEMMVVRVWVLVGGLSALLPETDARKSVEGLECFYHDLEFTEP